VHGIGHVSSDLVDVGSCGSLMHDQLSADLSKDGSDHVRQFDEPDVLIVRDDVVKEFLQLNLLQELLDDEVESLLVEEIKVVLEAFVSSDGLLYGGYLLVGHSELELLRLLQYLETFLFLVD